MHRIMHRIIHKVQYLFLSTLLDIITHLKKADETVQKLLVDAHEWVTLKMLIKRIRHHERIGYNDFQEVYRNFVEKKRQSLLKDSKKINKQFLEHLHERWEAKLPNDGLPPETQMEKAVMDTYYAYLKDDDVYQQKAFVLFLKKKMEEMKTNDPDYRKIKAYLKNKYENSSYEKYMECLSNPLDIHLPRLWIEFLTSGSGYENVIPKEKPGVAYFTCDTDTPPVLSSNGPIRMTIANRSFATDTLRNGRKQIGIPIMMIRRTSQITTMN